MFTHVTESKSGQVTVERQSAVLLAENGIDQIADDVAHQAAPPRLVFMYSGGTCSQEVPAEWSTEDDPQTDFKEYSGTADADAVALLCAGYQRSRPGLEMDLRQDLTQPASPVQGLLRWFSPENEWPSALPPASSEADGPTTVPSNVEGEPDLPIAAGSFLAGPPGWGSGTGGSTAVIGVTGDPDKVFDEYLRYQMNDPPKADEYLPGNLRVRQGTTGGAGGVTYTVTLNEIDGNAWILVGAYND